MKIAVVGGAGYIGSITTQMLCNLKYSVFVIDNLERGFIKAIDPRAKFIKGDIRNKEFIKKTLMDEKPDAVIHFASYIEVGESMQDPILFFDNNVSGSLNLIDAMLSSGCKKLIFSSTCATYGASNTTNMNESILQKPESVYGESKLMCETIFTWVQSIKDIECVIFRFFNACGASDKYGEAHNPETHLIPLTLQVVQGKRDSIYIYGDDHDTPDGTCIRDYTHVKDLASAHVLALKPGINGAFNLGTGIGHSVKEIIKTCSEITGYNIPVEVIMSRKGDCTRLVADASKAKRILGWEPTYTCIKQIIQSAWDWHKVNNHGYD